MQPPASGPSYPQPPIMGAPPISSHNLNPPSPSLGQVPAPPPMGGLPQPRLLNPHMGQGPPTTAPDASLGSQSSQNLPIHQVSPAYPLASGPPTMGPPSQQSGAQATPAMGPPPNSGTPHQPFPNNHPHIIPGERTSMNAQPANGVSSAYVDSKSDLQGPGLRPPPLSSGPPGPGYGQPPPTMVSLCVRRHPPIFTFDSMRSWI